MDTSPLEFRLDHQSGRARLTVIGEVDMLTREQFALAARAALDASGELDIDVAGVPFCDTEGISAFLGVSQLARIEGKQARLVDPSPYVGRMLRRTGLYELLTGQTHRPAA